MSSTAAPALPERLASEQEQSRYIWPPLVLSVILLWFVPMGTSLGLDESGTWWVVKDGFHPMLERAGWWPAGQSILFNLLVMGARSIGGDRDIVMRMPALLMSLGTLVLLYRLGKRLAGPLVAMFSCLVFVTMQEVIYVASVVRPYSLALLLVTGAVLALVNWLDTGRLRYGIAYVVLAGLTPYANYVYGLMFVVHAVYAAIRMRARDSAIRPRDLIAAWFASALLLLPLLDQVLSLYSRRARYSFLSFPSTVDVLAGIVPPVLGGASGLGILCALLLRWPISFSPPSLSTEGCLVALWALTPPALLLALGTLTDIQLFTGRYFICNAPGVALAVGLILGRLEPARIQRLIAASIAIGASLQFGVNEQFMRNLFDFRGAVAAVRERLGESRTVPVIVASGYIEGDKLSGVQFPAFSEVLLAPWLRYHVPGRLILVPGTLTEDAKSYLERIVTETLQDQREFLLLGPYRAEQYRLWLEGRCRGMGFTSRFFWNDNGVEGVLFERNATP